MYIYASPRRWPGQLASPGVFSRAAASRHWFTVSLTGAGLISPLWPGGGAASLCGDELHCMGAPASRVAFIGAPSQTDGAATAASSAYRRAAASTRPARHRRRQIMRRKRAGHKRRVPSPVTGHAAPDTPLTGARAATAARSGRRPVRIGHGSDNGTDDPRRV